MNTKIKVATDQITTVLNVQHDFKTMQHCFIKTNQFCSVAFYFFFILENANNQNLVIIYEIPNIAKTHNILELMVTIKSEFLKIFVI
jgi:hypothetical protein